MFSKVILTLGVILLLLLLAAVYSKLVSAVWFRRPLPPGRRVRVDGLELYATVMGRGGPAVVVETGLTCSSSEWRALQEELAQTTTVVTYDRPGYGWSGASTPRTPARIAGELHRLLAELGVPGPYILVGHSQGGLYMREFARLYRGETAGALFLDPLSPNDCRLRAELPPDVFRGSGADKAANLGLPLALSRLGLLRLLKPLLVMKLPQLRAAAPAVKRAAWEHFLRADAYRASMAENEQAHLEANLAPLRGMPPLTVPVRVILSSPRRSRAEIVKYGGLSEADAEQVVRLWQEIMAEYLTLSSRSSQIIAEESGHYIHLDQPAQVRGQIMEILEAIQAATPVDGGEMAGLNKP